MKSVISHSAEQTEQIAYDLARQLPAPQLIVLSGELGAGKTAFARGLVRGYGCDHPVTSPTFSIMNEYRHDIRHFDLYRLTSAEQLWEVGFYDYVDQGINIVEWGRSFVHNMPYVHITLKYAKSGNSREILHETVSN